MTLPGKLLVIFNIKAYYQQMTFFFSSTLSYTVHYTNISFQKKSLGQDLVMYLKGTLAVGPAVLQEMDSSSPAAATPVG